MMRDEYIVGVEKALEYIAAGDIYQKNTIRFDNHLSQRIIQRSKLTKLRARTQRAR